MLTPIKKLVGPLTKARAHPRFPGLFAFGGKGIKLEIRRSESPSQLEAFSKLWSAKNLSNDEYNLEQPIWISDLQFLDEKRLPEEGGFQIAVCTRYHQVSIPFLILTWLDLGI
jgi:hypothetical protein